MSTRRSGLIFALALASLAMAYCVALAAEFSADIVTSGGPMPSTGAIYVKGQNLRHEMTAGKQQSIVILNADKKMLWAVNPATKTYFGQPIPAADLSKMVAGMRGKLPAGATAQGFRTKRLGTETVNGYRCEKTQVEGHGAKITVCYSPKLELALRTEMSGSMGGKKLTTRQEVKNIKERKLPASLFAPPKGYKQITMPKMPKAPAPAPQKGAKGRGR